jgi:hypothetical protein
MFGHTLSTAILCLSGLAVGTLTLLGLYFRLCLTMGTKATEQGTTANSNSEQATREACAYALTGETV